LVWRGWTFFCGAPLGALCALAIDPQLGSLVFGLGSLAGGLALVLVAHLATRLGDADLERGWHLAGGATWALASVPAIAAALVGLGPTAPWLLSLCAAAAVAGVVLGARRRGPARSAAGWLASAAVVLAISSLGLVGLGALRAAFSPDLPAVSEQRAEAIYDADARIITQPLPSCLPRIAASRLLLDRGAHPRLGGDGHHLWFDAETEEGTRQVHRLELETLLVTCWTCGEPGNNQRPAPQRPGHSMIFDSDRHRSPTEPSNTELYLTRAVGSPGPARRISFHPGADDHALFMTSGVVVWSRGWGSTYDVVSATIRSGHGSRFLGTPGRMFRGGTHWAIPLSWSADLRHLVVGDGQPLRPLRVTLLDPATNIARTLPEQVAPGSAATFTADGGWMLIASTERAGIASLLPSALGFLLPRIAPGVADAGRFRTTQVRMGEPEHEGQTIELGEIGSWGYPTGISSSPTGQSFVLGQRRQTGAGVEERLLELVLDCSG
jgi:hypothetical protein